MRVDRTDSLTDLIVEFSFEPVNAPMVEFEPGTDEDKLAMNRFALSLLSGDVDQALDLSVVPQGRSREDGRQLLDAFSGMLSEYPDLMQLDRVVHMGDSRLMVWWLPVDTGERYYRSFRFIRDPSDGELRYEGVAPTDPVASLLTYTFQTGYEEGPDQRGPEEFDYDYDIPGTEGQPVRYRFDGVEIDVDAFNPLGETGNAAVDYYIEAMSALANGNPDDVAAFYTDFSQGRYSNWAVDQGAQAYEAFRQERLDLGSRIVFVMEAAPLYLIFYTPTDPTVTGAPLNYSAIYEHPEKGFQLTNFYVHGLADTVLKRREYFEEPFLRPLLANAGILARTQEPVGVVSTSSDNDIPDPMAMQAGWDFEPKGKTSIPTGVEDLAAQQSLWPWLAGAAVLIVATALLLLARRK
ncbi:hypothetical protein [Pelagicoccus sp. SDUM812005]|uniref:hypothetical protein n=1 Tax=Pelagicoccus sp. SDUM812005 TaxID=3041257 RepID=UPI00280EC492|nr:hypothetical protein [Pelagicoccus sp. SDUM812005]MDQ8180226.1 hypothetical protein [Pelagicoccus sp. SDUM812005]